MPVMNVFGWIGVVLFLAGIFVQIFAARKFKGLKKASASVNKKDKNRLRGIEICGKVLFYCGIVVLIESVG